MIMSIVRDQVAIGHVVVVKRMCSHVIDQDVKEIIGSLGELINPLMAFWLHY